MSSYVIEKEMYMRAAGLIAGIQDATKDHLIYDYTSHNWMESEGFLKKFSHFYDLNALSVVEQYNDPEMQRGTAANDAICKKVFDTYRRKGRMTWRSDKRKDLIMHLRNFFSCAEYQTEKESYHFEMIMFFDRLLVRLMKYLHTEYMDGWTDLEF